MWIKEGEIMLLRDLTEVWISEYEEINNHGEPDKKWKYKEKAFLNMQQDINELDRKSTGDIDYSITNARTTINYDIQKGNGISLIDISKSEEFKPDYIVTDKPRIYKLEKYNE